MSRRDRRNADPKVQERRTQLATAGETSAPFSNVPLIAPTSRGYGVPSGGAQDGGGYGVGTDGAKPASGQSPYANPFIIPKATGLNIISQTFPSNYYVEWNLSTWRAACDQCIKMGYSMSYATLVSWAFESSAFIQMLFQKLATAVDKTEFFVVDRKGNRMEDLTPELCDKPWMLQLRREIIFSFFWGFSGLNFDPVEGKIYKYPMQQIDPINRLLKDNTYSFYDGARFADHDNLLFVQPSTSYETFLGWMQPITRAFIQMNLANNNWISAGRRLAFPVMTIGYPQNDGARDPLGTQLNQYKLQAEDIAANIDPSKALVYPYTLDHKGEIVKSIEVGFEETKAGNNMYKIYSEFNDDQKNEIRELVLGGTLSSSGSKSGSGSRSLGEVHERMFQEVVESKIEFILAVLNTDFVPKITKFYKGLPDGWKYEINRAKQLTIEEMGQLSAVVTANGKRFTDEFFEANGLSKDFIEDAPTPVVATPQKPNTKGDPDGDVNRSRVIPFMGKSKKKSW
jgi:hypothetical protein